MADAGALSVGTLVVNLAMDTAGLQRSLDDIKRSNKSATEILTKQWSAAGGALGGFGRQINDVREGLEKAFGEKAPIAMRKFGAELGKALGLGDTAQKIEDIGSAVASLAGIFKAAGAAVAMLATPLGMIVAALGAIVAGVYAVSSAKIAETGGGWLSERVRDFRAGLEGIGAMAGGGTKEDLFKGWRGESKTPALLDTAKAKVEEWVKKLLELTEVGPTKGDVEKAKKDQEKSAKERKSILEAAFRDAKEQVEDDREAQLGFARERREANERIRRAQIETAEDLIADTQDVQAAYAQWADTVEAAAQAASQRWRAVGGGQFGTALGIEGTGGAALDIVGGAVASGGETTGAVLQGAAVGGQAGGGWGALIGAIVALLTKTEAFSTILEAIEELLDAIVPILDALLKPIAQLVEDVVGAIVPILGVLADVIGFVVKLLQATNLEWKGVSSLLKLVQSLINALGSLTSSLNSINIGSGGEGAPGLIDWLSLGAVFTGIQNVIEHKDFVSGQEWEHVKTEREQQESYAAAYRKRLEELQPYGATGDPQTWREAQNLKTATENQRRVMEALALAKRHEIEQANAAAIALKRLADTVQNAAAGYRIAGAMYRATGSIGEYGSD